MSLFLPKWHIAVRGERTAGWSALRTVCAPSHIADTARGTSGCSCRPRRAIHTKLLAPFSACSSISLRTHLAATASAMAAVDTRFMEADQEDTEQGNFGPGMEGATFLSNAEVAIVLDAHVKHADGKEQSGCAHACLAQQASCRATSSAMPQDLHQGAQFLQEVWWHSGR